MSTSPKPEPLTPEREQEIRRHASTATAGPWGTYDYGDAAGLVEIAADLEETGSGYTARRGICRFEDEPLDNDPTHATWTAEEDNDQILADAEFIAHARTDIPTLLTEIDRLRAELEQWRAQRNQLAETNANLHSQLAEAQDERLTAQNDALTARRETERLRHTADGGGELFAGELAGLRSTVGLLRSDAHHGSLDDVRQHLAEHDEETRAGLDAQKKRDDTGEGGAR